MAIKVACPHCDQVHTLSDTQEGKTIRCKSCDEKFAVSKPRRRADEEEEDRPSAWPGVRAVIVMTLTRTTGHIAESETATSRCGPGWREGADCSSSCC